MKRERRTELRKKANWLAADLLLRWGRMDFGAGENWYETLTDEEFAFVEQHIRKLAERLESAR